LLERKVGSVIWTADWDKISMEDKRVSGERGQGGVFLHHKSCQKREGKNHGEGRRGGVNLPRKSRGKEGETEGVVRRVPRNGT